MIEEILSSSEGSLVKIPKPAAVPQGSPVLESEQASTENSPKQTPAPQPVLKRKAEAKLSTATKSSAEPSAKRAKSEVEPSPKLEKFQKSGTEFDLYVREDKSLLGKAQLLKLAQKLSE